MTWAGLVTAATPAPASGLSTGSPLFDMLLQNASPLVLLLVGLWAFGTGKVVSGTEHKRVVDKLERVEAQRDALHDSMAEKVVPALTRTFDVIERIEDREQRRADGER